MAKRTVTILKGWKGRPTGSKATVDQKIAKRWIAAKIAKDTK